MSAIKTLFGLDLPKEGTVRGKAVDQPRSVDYGGVVGRVDINKKPVYWLAIQPKGSKKIRNVPVTKKVYDAHNEGDQWTATE
ncbi:MAG TPA: hypothetical protein VF773_15930 [Verrucomicrobiae bacterium]